MTYYIIVLGDTAKVLARTDSEYGIDIQTLSAGIASSSVVMTDWIDLENVIDWSRVIA